MPSNETESGCICPHCGVSHNGAPDAWLAGLEDEAPRHCPNCQQLLDGNTSSDCTIDKNESGRNFNLSFFIIVLLLSTLMIYLNRTFDVLTLKEDKGQIVYEILAILIASSALASGKIRENLKYLAIWIGIFGILVTGYSYRHELFAVKEKVLSEIMPAKGIQNAPNSISFPLSSDGHFYIQAEVNGTPVMFMADTGASHIMLSPADAQRLGIRTDEIHFDRFYETANGTVRGSSITIDELRIGQIQLKEIGASINEAKMRDSLLGMTFFKRLKSYEVKNDVLTLYHIE